MNKIKEDLLLHPIRLRIVLAAAGREVTALELAKELPDVPQATLYRNLNTLASAGILTVVRERRVHNAIEKTYALPSQDLLLSVEDLQDARPEDYIRLFTQYLGLQLGYFVRYVQQGDVDLARDHVVFHMFPVYLNEEETLRMGEAVNEALLPFAKYEPSPDRRRSILGLLSLPDFVGAPLPAGSQAGAQAIGSTDSTGEEIQA